MSRLYALLFASCSLSAQLAFGCDRDAVAAAGAISVQDRAATAFVEREAGRVYLGWRLLGSDEEDVTFDVYRCKGKEAANKVNVRPLTRGTNIIDSQGCASYSTCADVTWAVATLKDKTVVSVTPSIGVANSSEQNLLQVPTGIPAFGRNPAWGDVNADGVLDFVLRYSDVTVDPYFKLWRPSPGTYKLVAFDSNGQALWRYDMGPSIERGMWYSPYLVYDLDQDGAAELIVKGGDAGQKREALTDKSGRITKGAEYLKIVSGRDGSTVLATAPWPDRSGFTGGTEPHSQYNRYSRNQMAIAYVDGKHPHVVVVRGTYGKQKADVYRYRSKEGLTLAWQWQNRNPRPSLEQGEQAQYRELDKWWGQGAHTIRVGDVDNDGKDEIIIGGVALDDDGTPLWSINKGDVDHIYLGDINPQVPGLEMYYGAERGQSRGGMGMVSARSGQILWQHTKPTRHIHKEGLCADLYQAHEGSECYSGEADESAFWLWSSAGELLHKKPMGGLAPNAVYWGPGAQKSLVRLASDKDDALFAELLNAQTGEVVDRLHKPSNMAAADRQYIKLLAVADIVGDWREEILAVDRGNLLIYMSTLPTAIRQPWLMGDHTYKMNAILGSMGYYHQPLLGYDLQTAVKSQAQKSEKEGVMGQAPDSISNSDGPK